MTGNVSLLDRISAKVSAGDFQLPPCNGMVEKLQQITSNPDFDIQDVVEVISNDPSLTTEILRVANSSFYGGLTEIKTVKDAAVRLGPQEVVRISVLVTEKALYQVKTPSLKAFLEPLWQHAQATAIGSRWLTNKLGYHDLENQAFIGGLLHDAGSLLLVRVIDEIFQEDPSAATLSETLIAEIIETAHTSEGHKMAELWGLPDLYCNIIRDHHLEDLSQAGTLTNLVALVDKACIQLGLGLESDASIVLDATGEAYTLACSDIVLAQLTVLLEDEMQLV